MLPRNSKMHDNKNASMHFLKGIVGSPPLKNSMSAACYEKCPFYCMHICVSVCFDNVGT